MTTSPQQTFEAACHTVCRSPLAAASLAIAGIGAISILGAWFFQYVIGLQPCPLCLEQRIAYYFATPLAVLVFLGARYGASRRVLFIAFAAMALAMLWNAGLGAYHAGVEWKFWPGPQDCGAGQLGDLNSTGNLLQTLETVRVVRCDEIPWSFLGLSLAGYNVLISLAMVAFAIFGAAMAWREAPAREKIS